MTETPSPLAPDDAEQPGIALITPPATIAPPYGYAAILCGLAIYQLGYAVAPGAPPLWLLLVTLAGIATGYLLLVLTRPRLPLTMLCVLASIFGMLYSVPSALLRPTEHELGALFMLGAMVILSGITGGVIARGLEVEKYPHYVIPISFLATFVLIGLLQPNM